MRTETVPSTTFLELPKPSLFLETPQHHEELLIQIINGNFGIRYSAHSISCYRSLTIPPENIIKVYSSGGKQVNCHNKIAHQAKKFKIQSYHQRHHSPFFLVSLLTINNFLSPTSHISTNFGNKFANWERFVLERIYVLLGFWTIYEMETLSYFLFHLPLN